METSASERSRASPIFVAAALVFWMDSFDGSMTCTLEWII